MNNEKISALTNLLDNDEEDIMITECEDDLFRAGEREFLILTDDEANKIASEHILDNILNLDSKFILDNLNSLYVKHREVAERIIKKAKKDNDEDGKEVLLSLIDEEELVDTVIKHYGRVNFIDGCYEEEIERSGYFIYEMY